MLRTLLTSILMALAFVTSAISLTSCGGGSTNRSQSNSAPVVQPSPTPEMTAFEKDLDYVRKGQYTYILVFSRKDGKVLDKNDAAYLRTNAPQVVDWVTTDEGKKVIAGTNFDLKKGNLDLLKKRFNVEDYTGK